MPSSDEKEEHFWPNYGFLDYKDEQKLTVCHIILTHSQKKSCVLNAYCRIGR